MPRYVFHSFYYDEDCHRAQLVRNIGAVTGNKMAHPNDWETVKRGGDAAIKRWIDNELDGKSCLIALIGRNTASRPWCLYEIKRAWELKKGVLGIHIHGLKNLSGLTSTMGMNPITHLNALGPSAYGVPVKNPAGWDSQQVYASISNNITAWIDEAIAFRKQYA